MNKALNVLFFAKWLKKVIQNEYSIYGFGVVWVDLFDLYVGGFILGIDRNIAIGWRKRQMTKDKALEMALELIEQLNMDGWVLADFEPQMYACIAAIKETLTQPVKGSCAECGVGDGHALYCVACAEKFIAQTETKDKPVATVISESGANVTYSWWHEPALPIGTKLYTSPQRTWVWLSDEDKQKLAAEHHDWESLCFAVEAKLKEKNVT